MTYRAGWMCGISEKSYATLVPRLQLWSIVQPVLRTCVSRATYNVRAVTYLHDGPGCADQFANAKWPVRPWAFSELPLLFLVHGLPGLSCLSFSPSDAVY